jgi:hypothetical protein
MNNKRRNSYENVVASLTAILLLAASPVLAQTDTSDMVMAAVKLAIYSKKCEPLPSNVDQTVTLILKAASQPFEPARSKSVSLALEERLRSGQDRSASTDRYVSARARHERPDATCPNCAIIDLPAPA